MRIGASTRSLGWVYLFCVSCFPALTQQNGDARSVQAPASGAAGVANHSITLDVVVADKAGHVAGGLQQQDFILLDNKAAQKITSFRAVERPTATADPSVEVILLVDEVNAPVADVARQRQAIEKFLKQNGGELVRPVSIVFFSDTGTTIGNAPSQDGKILIAELNRTSSSLRVIGRSQGVYGAADRLQLSLRTLGQLADYEANRPGRKLVVWISPGWPLLSGPNIELTPKDQQALFNNIVALSDGLRNARITLYSVDPLGTADAAGFRTTYYKEFLKGVTAANHAQAGNLALQVLAYQSGGRVLNSDNDMAGEIAACINDANAFYVLTFEGEPGDGPNEYHGLEVKIDKPGLIARTRSGYYAQPEHRPTSN